MKTYYTIYRITNKTSGKLYIGAHKTRNLDDEYMGSGKYLKRAVAKHGIDNFTKEILFVYDNPEEMYAKEAELVDADFLSEANTYNLRIGGFGGFDYVNANPDLFLTEKRLNSLNSPEFQEKRIATWLRKYNTDDAFNAKVKDNCAKATNASMKNNPNGTFYGRTHTDETKAKMSEAKKGIYTGERNSQFGSIWITDGTSNRKIKNTDDVPDGFRRGRVQKKVNLS